MSSRLAEIDAAAVYSNHGPQERRLRHALADRLGGRPAEEIATFSSGTTALVAVLRSFALAPGAPCLVPSWSFIGSACAVAEAGLEPHFIDVNAASWTPDIAALEAVARASGAQAAMIVAPFGAAVDYDGLVELSQRTGLRILIDGAAAFDWVERIAGERTVLPLPIMVSLHATKLVSALEGGFVVQSDPDAVRTMVEWSNFGIFGDRPVRVRGTNAKLSEVHAAYALASLEMWPQTRPILLELVDSYRSALRDVGCQLDLAPNLATGLASSTFNLVCAGPDDGLDARLAALGIETRRWWRRGIHRFPAFADAPAEPLPVTEWLAERVIGLPFHEGVSEADAKWVAAGLAKALRG